jgi:hypothetical protein
MNVSQIHFEQDLRNNGEFRTGVSLHGHTLHSQEKLDFIYRLATQITPLRLALERGEARYRNIHGASLDLSRAWWTPPLSAYDAWKLEASHIAERFDLAPLVSLSDHDNVDAPILLQHREECRPVPVSVEWTVPYGGTFFHLGIHNMAVENARAIMTELEAFTAQTSRMPLADLLRMLTSNRDTLVIFNHPNWDENKIGEEAHRAAARQFSSIYKQYIHAFELNGLRPWSENRTVVDLARQFGKPIISGGDRHGLEANTILNLSTATSFSEFVDEIRDGYSHVVLTRRYMEPLAMRILENIEDVLQNYDNHVYGRHWSDRAFYLCDDGVARSLKTLWGTEPLAVRLFTNGVNLMRNPRFKHAFRVAFAKREEVVL